MLKHAGRSGRPRVIMRKKRGRSLSRSWPGTPSTLSIVSSEVKETQKSHFLKSPLIPSEIFLNFKGLKNVEVNWWKAMESQGRYVI